MPPIKLSSPVAKDRVVQLVRTHLPDLDLGSLGAGVTVASSRWVAAAIWVNKKAVNVMPSMRSPQMFALFVLMALTGIGLAIYAVAILPKQKALADRVEGVLRRELAGQTKTG